MGRGDRDREGRRRPHELTLSRCHPERNLGIGEADAKVESKDPYWPETMCDCELELG